MDDTPSFLEPLPPHISYWDFGGMLDAFKANGIPEVVDADSVPGPRKTAYRYLSALRGAGLINDFGRPEPDLKTLVAARETENWRPALRKLLERTYPFILDRHNLAEIDSRGLERAFVEHAGREVPARANRETFFLNAAVDAGMKLSAPLAHRVMVSRAANRVRGRKPENRGHRIQPDPESGAMNHAEVAKGAETEQAADVAKPIDSEGLQPLWTLLGLLDDDKMSAREKEAVLTLMKYVKRTLGR